MTAGRSSELLVPRYGRASLADLLPSILGAMGAPGIRGPIDLQPAERVCLLLVDGLGLHLLERHRAEAPFIAGLLDSAILLDAAFPTSTAVSLCSLSTGLPPGTHGVTGYTMAPPEIDGVLQCLVWQDYATGEDLTRRLPPAKVQQVRPLFLTAADAGIRTAIVSHADHDASGLTLAAFHDTRFVPLRSFAATADRIAAIGGVLNEGDRALVYTYDPRLDTAAHVHGIDSPEWRSALREIDRLVMDLARRLPRGARLYVTGDHGGLDLRHGDAGRIDVAHDERLHTGVRGLAGEPRMRHVHAEAAQAGDVIDRWRNVLGDRCLVLTRDQAIGRGLFGPVVAAEVRPRIGDAVVIPLGEIGIFDSRLAAFELTLVAMHGALTADELHVPLLSAECGRGA